MLNEMPVFNSDEKTLICLYNSGTRQGLIRELNEMLPYLGIDQTELRCMTASVLRKLNEMTDAQFNVLIQEWETEN